MRKATMTKLAPVLWAFTALLGWAVDGALAAEPTAGGPACTSGQIAAAGKCVAADEATRTIDAIVRDAMAKHELKAVLAGVAIDGQPLFTSAWGESMTGVPATPDMHFRNGSIAIAYIGTVLLQLSDKGILSLGDKLSKWFPEYPKADQVTLEMLINGTSGYADYVPDKSFEALFYADPFRALDAGGTDRDRAQARRWPAIPASAGHTRTPTSSSSARCWKRRLAGRSKT